MYGAQKHLFECMPHSLQKCTCIGACAPMQLCRNIFAKETIAVLRKHRTVCRLRRFPQALLLSRRNQSPDAARSRKLSKFMLVHDEVTSAVSHKQHSIIWVGAGLSHPVCIWFAVEAWPGAHHHVIIFLQFFARVNSFALLFQKEKYVKEKKHLVKISSRNLAYMYTCVFCTQIRISICRPSGFFRPSKCLISTPGLTSSTSCAMCVCVCVYIHIHPRTLPPASK